MKNYNKEFLSESQYLNIVLKYAKKKLIELTTDIKSCKSTLIASKKDVWDNYSHSYEDIDKAIDNLQYLKDIKSKDASLLDKNNEIINLNRLIKSPYFARIDFNENQTDEIEKIYIGRNTLMDKSTNDILVHDWRAPIASIYYRFELGPVWYKAPQDIINGKVILKRQYEIKESELKYFFDSSLEIADDFLRNMLSKNSSKKMTTIVETIQKDQDKIIRNIENKLLMVQGVAGSGKTSVALHRVAYLMYEGLSSRTFNNNIIVISPNQLFKKYISDVLPELGEKNVKTLSFDDIICNNLQEEGLGIQKRNQLYENMMTCNNSAYLSIMKSSIIFKSSTNFIKLIDNLVSIFERKCICINDIYYNGKILIKKELLIGRFLQTPGLPLQEKLIKIKTFILDKVRDEAKTRIKKLEKFARGSDANMFHSKAYARAISIQENRKLVIDLMKRLKISTVQIYKELFFNDSIFSLATKNILLPKNIKEILAYTKKDLSNGILKYEDALAVALINLKISRRFVNSNISQIIIDEAQDYYDINFVLLKKLFPTAAYTILGDVNQTIGKKESITFFNNVQAALDIKSSLLLSLNKSFRCTNEIINFSSRFIDNVDIQCFNRKGAKPEILLHENTESSCKKLVEYINITKCAYKFTTICILCKSLDEATKLYMSLRDYLSIELVNEEFKNEFTGVIITSIYLAKGLEFDCVVIYNADTKNYESEEDKNLLYVASTRALHKLDIFCVGKPSRFLREV